MTQTQTEVSLERRPGIELQIRQPVEQEIRRLGDCFCSCSLPDLLFKRYCGPPMRTIGTWVASPNDTVNRFRTNHWPVDGR